MLMAGGELVVAPFVFDGLQARLAVSAGFRCVYMTGFGTAAARGLPDVGILGRAEMVENARTIVRAAGVPVVCDADTGYGNAVNVWHTVREFEDAGAAAVHVEDQVWPKRCGFLAGKQVIAAEEMVEKVRAACAARRDPDLVLIARTDALAPLGFDEAIRRARLYHAAGADLVFVDGLRTHDDMERTASALRGLPLLYNGLLPSADVAPHGYRLMIHIAPLLAAYTHMRDVYAELARQGCLDDPLDWTTLSSMATVLGFDELEEIGRRFGGGRG